MSLRNKLILFIAAFIPVCAFAADAKHWDASGAAVFGAISNGTTGADAFAIDATTDKIHWVFQADQSCTADAVGFYYQGRTGTPVAHEIGIQSVATDGNGGNGTYLSSGNAKGAFTPPADSSWNDTWRSVSLTSSIALTRGTFYSVTLQPTGTPSGANNVGVYYRIPNSYQSGTSYAVTVNGGSASKINNFPIFAVYCGSTVIGAPSKGTVEHFWNSGTEERGLEFTIPAALCSTASILGLGGYFRTDTGGTVVMQLYSGGASGDTTVLDDVTVDTDAVASSSSNQQHALYFDGTATTITCGSTYRISLKPSAAIGTRMVTLNVNANSDLGAYHAGATGYTYTVRDGGSWTDTTTSRPAVWPILQDFTPPSGGGIKNHNQASGGSQ